MKTIQSYIDSKQSEFKNHPFFTLLAELESIEDIGSFVPELTFWAMTFQDILRLNETRIQDPYLKKIARHHRLEDAGHEQWFLQDKEYFNNKNPAICAINQDIAWLYGQESQATRDAAYAIVSEVYKADNELINIAMLLTLESSGHVFFERVAAQVKKTGEDKALRYFSSAHLEVELAHALFEEAMEQDLFAIQVPLAVRRKAVAMIDRCYDAFNAMFDGLLHTCHNRLKEAKQRTLYVTQNMDQVADHTM